MLLIKPYKLAALAATLHSFFDHVVFAAEGPVITPAPVVARDAAPSSPPILSTLEFPFSSLPEQVYPFTVGRGPQTGYNICNSTTLGPNSLCQTLIFNGPDDFCLWGSPTANGSIGDVEQSVVAYCTKPYHGTRLIPPGAITGLQWMKTSAYIQATGFISNSGLGLASDDSGGELDPHGADLEGNPLGGVVYSNGTADSDGHTLVQVHNWNMFVGSNQFCAKICFNSITNPDFCQNRYDLIGCSYNMPSNVQEGEFTSCEGGLQDEVGIYTSNGQVLTYTMPATLSVNPPYTPRVPSSSNCQTFQSTDLFLAVGATAAPTSTSTSAAAAPTPSGGASGTPSGKAPTTGTQSQTGSQTNNPIPTQKGGASSVHVPMIQVLALIGGAMAILL